MPNPIRILHVVTSMERAGLETMIMNYYRHIDRNLVQFDFLVHRPYQCAYDEEILSMGGKIYHLPKLNPFSKSYIRALDDFFANHHAEYQIVHSHLDCMAGIPLKYAAQNGIPIRIAHAHSRNQDRDLKYPLKLFFKRMIPRYANNLFACSQEAGEWMFNGHKFKIIQNAIDTKRYIYNEEICRNMRDELGINGCYVIGHVGRLTPAKNHLFLLDVFNEVHKRDSNSVLLLIGEGERRNEIEKKIVSLHLENAVYLLGSRADIPAILQAIDVFVFPSLHEGLGIAAIEAQAAGIPCVLSSCIPESCKISADVRYLSISSHPQKWRDVILDLKNHVKHNAEYSVKINGFDITDEAKNMQEFYLSFDNEVSQQL